MEGADKDEARVWDRQGRNSQFSSAAPAGPALVTRRDRLFELAKWHWQQQRQGGLMLPKDVCRLIAGHVPRAAVVVWGGQRNTGRAESGNSDGGSDLDDNAAYALDLSASCGLWRTVWAEEVLDLRPKQPPASELALNKHSQVLWARGAGGEWYAGVFSTRLISCNECKRGDSDGKHCCCCCPRYYHVAANGTVSPLPPVHTVDNGRENGAALSDCAMVCVRGELWVVGGEHQHGCPTCTMPTVETFVLDLRETSAGWRRGPPLPARRMQHAGVCLADGRILVVGGMDGDCLRGYRAFATTFVLEPEATEWIVGPDLPCRRCRLQITTV